MAGTSHLDINKLTVYMEERDGPGNWLEKEKVVLGNVYKTELSLVCPVFENLS